jgi:hypothetical protein
MSEKDGVCAIVPAGQNGLRPHVIGMGILVGDGEVITCAHVVGFALELASLEQPPKATVRVCFPFDPAALCITGKVDPARWLPPRKTMDGSVTDVAVIRLDADAPIGVGRALLKDHIVGASARVYGFRKKEAEGGTHVSHTYGEWARGEVAGPQPAGRAQFDGCTSGASIEKGYSGGAVYDAAREAVVGMIVLADRDKTLRIAQFIDAESLRTALGWPAASRPPIPNIFNTPPLPTYYVRRTEDIDGIIRELQRPAASGVLRLVVLHGTGGIGKSTLAKAVCHDPRIATSFPDGVLWTEVREEPNILGCLAQWSRLLGDRSLQASTIGELLDRVRASLRGRAVLLVLDDVWSALHIKDLLLGDSNSRVLITTRRGALADDLQAATCHIGAMSVENALAMFTMRLDRILTDIERAQAADLAAALGYLPLALQLAAAMIARGATWSEVSSAFQAEILRTPASKPYISRQLETIQACFNISIERIRTEAPDIHRFFLLLGVLAKGAAFEPQTASHLWNVSLTIAQHALNALVDDAVVQFVSGGYRLHDLIHGMVCQLLHSLPPHGLGIAPETAHASLLSAYFSRAASGGADMLLGDSYMMEHATWHMDKAGWVDQLHHVLSRTTTLGRNARYDSLYRRAALHVYSGDLTRGFAIGLRTGCAVSLLARYALSEASLVSRDRRLSVTLVRVLLERRLMTFAQGLAWAARVPRAYDSALAHVTVAEAMARLDVKQRLLPLALREAQERIDKLTVPNLRAELAVRLACADPTQPYETMAAPAVRALAELPSFEHLIATLLSTLPVHFQHRALADLIPLQRRGTCRPALVRTLVSHIDNLPAASRLLWCNHFLQWCRSQLSTLASADFPARANPENASSEDSAVSHHGMEQSAPESTARDVAVKEADVALSARRAGQHDDRSRHNRASPLSSVEIRDSDVTLPNAQGCSEHMSGDSQELVGHVLELLASVIDKNHAQMLVDLAIHASCPTAVANFRRAGKGGSFVARRLAQVPSFNDEFALRTTQILYAELDDEQKHVVRSDLEKRLRDMNVAPAVAYLHALKDTMEAPWVRRMASAYAAVARTLKWGEAGYTSVCLLARLASLLPPEEQTDMVTWTLAHTVRKPTSWQEMKSVEALAEVVTDERLLDLLDDLEIDDSREQARFRFIAASELRDPSVLESLVSAHKTDPRLRALAKMVQSLAEAIGADNLHEFVEEASNQASEWWVAESLSAVSMRITHKAEQQRIIDVTRGFKNPDLAARVIGSVMTQAALSGDESQAIAWSKEISLIPYRWRILCDLAVKLAECGRVTAAGVIAEAIEDREERGRAEGLTALQLAAFGDVETGRELAGVIESPNWRAWTMERVGLPAATEGQYRPRTVQRLTSDPDWYLASCRARAMETSEIGRHWRRLMAVMEQTASAELGERLARFWRERENGVTFWEALGKQARTELLEDCRRLCPIVHRCVGPDALREMVAAVDKVVQWWP